MKSKAALFLNGAYPPDHVYFYVREYRLAARDSIIIVTDGGLQFFINHELTPDLIIGDWDSADIGLIKSYPKAVTLNIPAEGKGQTDSELALEWCVNNSIRDAVIYGGIDTSFESDHLLGNIFLLFKFREKFDSIYMRDYCQEIVALEDESYTGNGNPGDFISVVPLSESIIYAGDGLLYDPGRRKYLFGQSTSLRNRLAEKIFHVEIEGRAVLVRHF